MANKPTHTASAHDSDSHTDWKIAYADLAREQRSQASDIVTMKWVMGFGFGLVLITNGVVVALTVLALSWNNDLRAELNALKVEFEVYKAENPPSTSPIPPE